MSKKQRMSLCSFLDRFGTEEACRKYLAEQHWPEGFVCPKCGHKHGCNLSNGLCQCNHCHHQTSVTADTVLHRSHVSLRKWFFAFYLVFQDKRGISAVQLSAQIGVTYKTAWSMLRRIRSAMGQRDKKHILTGVAEFDDAYFGGPTAGGKRGRGTEKAKVFVALKKFANTAIEKGSTIHSDGYRSYIPALQEYKHEHKVYDPNSGMLHWLHIVISNAKSFILGTYHGLPHDNLQHYMDEFAFRFSRRMFGDELTLRLALAVARSRMA